MPVVVGLGQVIPFVVIARALLRLLLLLLLLLAVLVLLLRLPVLKS